MDHLQLNNNYRRDLSEWTINFIVLGSLFFLCWIAIFNAPNVAGFLIFMSLVSIILFITKDIYSLVFISLFILINNQLLGANFKIGPMYISVKWITYPFIGICFLSILLDGKYKKFKNSNKITKNMYILGYIYMLFVNIINKNINIDFSITVLYFFAIGMILQILVNSDEKYSRALIKAYFISIAAIVIVGYIELIIGKTFFLSKWTLEERYRFGIMRIGSTVGDGNFMCLLLIPSYVLFKSKAFSNVINKIIINLFRILIFIQVIITTSRTGLLVLLIVQCLMYLYKYKYLLGMFISSTIITIPYINKLAYNLYNTDLGSNFARETMSELAHNIWINNIYFGIGFGNFANISKQYTVGAIVDALQTMNTYYFILTSSGILGLILYVLYIIITIKEDLIKFFRSKESSYIVIAIIGWSIMVSTLDAFYIIFLWMIPSLVMAIKREDEI